MIAFPNQTDILSVREVAKNFLHQKPYKTKYGFVSHPFVNDDTVNNKNGIRFNIFENPDLWTEWQNEVSESFDAYSLEAILLYIQSDYCFSFLQKIMLSVSREDFSKSLADVYVHANNIYAFYDDVLEFFKNADQQFLMDDEEKEVFNTLPETITVYRGVKYKKHAFGFSWTVSREQAQWFANRGTRAGYVYSAKINKKDVYAYFNARREEEIVLNPEKLFEVTLITPNGI